MTEEQAEPGDAANVREFEVDGIAWIAEVTGRGAAGGPSSAGVLESVYFRGPDPASPAVWLAYLPAGRFPALMDEELREILRSAPPLAPRPEPAGEDRERAADRSDRAIEDYRSGADG